MNVIKNERLIEFLSQYPDEAEVVLCFKEQIGDYDDGFRNIGSVLAEYIQEDEFDVPTIIIKSWW